MESTDQALRYREISRLGSGGMATVTLAEDTLLGRRVALKRVHVADDERATLRLKREALMGASLNHPNLVSVFDVVVEEDGDVTIVMEYVPGSTLADVIRAGGGLPSREALRVLREMAAVLDTIHERGVTHRDIKPANILLGEDGAVKLADLGVADAADRTRITSADAVVGSFSYMAPEQLEGERPSRSMDIYALAAVAYELLSGQRARPESNPLALARAISTQPPPDLKEAWPEGPAEAAAVLQRAMSADPAKRPSSAGELVRQLEHSLEPAPAPQAQAPAKAAPRTASKRRPAPVPWEALTPAAGAAPPAAPPARPRPSPPPPAPPRRTSRLAPILLLVAALVTAGVVVAVLDNGGSTRSRVAASRKPAAHHHRAAKASAPAARASAPASPAAASSGSTSASGGSSPPGVTGASGATAAVEQFYELAAQHRYAAAWALADQNLRNQLRGYSSFAAQMSSVRSITFHRAQVIGQPSPNEATVGLQTTSVQTSQTQECSGSARTVRSGGAWLLDSVSITCA